jgi:Zn-dependent alcohol dehydrogenase
LPAVLGHEGAGVVDAVGPDVAGLDVGQPVVLSLAPSCESCPHCLRGRPILCQDALDAMAEGRLTTGPSPIRGRAGPIAAYSLLGCFARHAVVASDSAIPLPDGVSPAVAALIGCAVITGVGAATESGAIEEESRGAVIGAGGVGMNAIQGARLCGAAEVVAFDVAPGRLAEAGRFGATQTVDVGDAQKVERLRSVARREGFDWSIVTVGREDAVRLGIELTRPGATTVVVGLLPDGSPVPVDVLDLVTYEKRIVGSAYGSTSPRALMPRIAQLYLDGFLALDELVTARLPLAAIDEAFARSRRADGLRPVLTMPEADASA